MLGIIAWSSNPPISIIGHNITEISNIFKTKKSSPGNLSTSTLGGQLYYLLPPKTPIKEAGLGTGVVRIKLVISKQELKDLVLKGGVTFDGMISLGQRGPSNRRSGDGEEKCIGWRPALESIPEGNDC